VAETTDKENRKAPTYLWSTRHDVWINYLGKHGDLTVGYGSPREGFGPEFNFGHVLGNYYDEQVLIIKASWGGRALARGFLPPSSMLSDAEYANLVAAQNAENEAWNAAEPAKIESYNQKITEKNKTADKKKPLRKFRPREIVTVEQYKDQFGKDYRNMVSEVHGCLAELGDRFPDYRNQGYEIQGFVWFQGWNDQYQDRWLTYEKNMANFIRDVRQEFKSPDMSFVIGQMGNDGLKADAEGSPRDYIKKAQLAVPNSSEFKSNAICVKTDRFWDMDAHAIYTGPGGWSKDVDKWRQFGNDRPYHYYGSPWFFAQAGTGFGEAMVKLLR
jgi:alpha-galactosidase